MKSPRSTRWAQAGLVLLACVTLLVLPGRGQVGGRSTARAVVQNTGLPGVDRGLREHDRPIEPSARGSRGMRAQMRRGDGARNDRTYLAGSVIVKFRAGAPGSTVNSAMRAAAASTIQRPSNADFDILQIPPDADPEAVAAALRLNPDVEYAQPRYRNYPMLRPNDPFYDRQWSLPALDMERAWDIQPQAGSEVVVAVLDTGVAFRTVTLQYTADSFQLTAGGPEYPALGSVSVPFAVAPELGDAKFVSPWDFIWDDDLPVDLDGHGTHVSGTIGQLTNNGVGVAGMAYNVRIMPVKVLDDVWDFIFNSPFIGTDDTVARGIRYAADNGAKVINMSIGRSEGGPPPSLTRRFGMRFLVAPSSWWPAGTPRIRATRPVERQNRRRPFRAWCRSAPSGERSSVRITRRPTATSNSRRPEGTSAVTAAPEAYCSRRSISICCTPTNSAPKASALRAPTCLRTTTSRAPRWRCRTCPRLPRC
jgi:hypothetical protein